MILGIDIGGSKVALGVADHAGQLLARRRRGALGADPRTELGALVADARALLAEAGVSRLEAIGIAAPGPLDRARGVLCDPPNLPHWGEVPLVQHLCESLGAPAAKRNCFVARSGGEAWVTRRLSSRSTPPSPRRTR